MTLPAHMVARLKRLVPLLGSPLDGEALAARNAIVRELAAGQRDLHDLAASIGGSLQAQCVGGAPVAPTHCFGDLARAARDLDRGRLTPYEREFVVKMCRRGWTFQPSPKQVALLDKILNQLRTREAA